MKKVLVAGTALMLVSGCYAASVSAADVKPGVVVTGDARVRLYYKSDEYFNNGTSDALSKAKGSQTNMDSRVRLNVTGTAAGGAYAVARIRMDESNMGAMDNDLNGINNMNQNNIWVDKAYVGIPFSNMFTLEVGKYRSTYGPLPLTYNFFYDDVQLSGARGIVKVNNIEINPFIEYMNEAQGGYSTADVSSSTDSAWDNDELRYGAHIKAKINKDWIVGGMLAYQTDQRAEIYSTTVNARPNDGFFGSVYTNGKYNAFGLVGELAYTQDKLNGMNTWAEDTNGIASVAPGDARIDHIGSKDDGYGGYINPSYQIDKLNLGVVAGFTSNGFRPDVAYGFVMIGGKDNSIIGDSVRIGETGDWAWFGFVPSYAISDSLKLTGNFVYANVNSVDLTSAAAQAAMLKGQGDVPYTAAKALDSAWELSAVLQYTISKGADVFFSAGYLKPDYVDSTLRDDGALGVATRFELAF